MAFISFHSLWSNFVIRSFKMSMRIIAFSNYETNLSKSIIYNGIVVAKFCSASSSYFSSIKVFMFNNHLCGTFAVKLPQDKKVQGNSFRSLFIAFVNRMTCLIFPQTSVISLWNFFWVFIAYQCKVMFQFKSLTTVDEKLPNIK